MPTRHFPSPKIEMKTRDKRQHESNEKDKWKYFEWPIDCNLYKPDLHQLLCVGVSQFGFFFLWNFVICWKVDKAPTTHASSAKCIPPATLVLSSATCCNLEIPSVTYCNLVKPIVPHCTRLVASVTTWSPQCTLRLPPAPGQGAQTVKRPGQPQWPVICLQSVKA